MKRAILPTAILTACVFALFSSHTQAEPAPIQDGSFPFYLSATRMIVMVRVAGGAPTPMVFDTGTNGNLVDTTFAETLNLPHTGPSDSIDGSTGRPVPGYKTRLVHASVGGFPMADGPAAVVDYKAEDEVGVIGPNSFPGKLVMLDFKAKRVRVFGPTSKRAPQGPGVPYKDQLPSIKIVIGGTEIDAKLDTGNDSPLILPMSLLKTLKMKLPPKCSDAQ